MDLEYSITPPMSPCGEDDNDFEGVFEDRSPETPKGAFVERFRQGLYFVRYGLG